MSKLSKELLDFCQTDVEIFQDIVMPGTSLGSL